jgi:hypothetical protein
MRHRLALAPVVLVAAAAHGQILYFADIFRPTLDDGSVKRLDATAGVPTSVVNVGGGLRAVAVDGAAGKVYWCDVNNFKISRANLDGSSPQDIITTGLEFPAGIALDTVHGKIYWGDASAGEISRANLDGSSVEPVLSTPFYRGLALDVAGGKMYWTTSVSSVNGRIMRANLDGTASETVVSGLNSFKPADISLDLVRNRIFWTDTVTATLRRSTLDGADQVTLFTDLSGNTPRAVAVKPSNGDVYWSHDTDASSVSGEINVAVGGEAVFEPVDSTGLGHVNSISLLAGQVLYFADIFRPTLDDGSIKRLEVTAGPATPVITVGGGLRAVAVDGAGGKVYWSDVNTFKISRANLDGSSPHDIITTGLQFPAGIALDTVHGKIYWGDTSAEEISRANLDGSNVEPVLSTPFFRGLALDVASNKMYWTTSVSSVNGRIMRANLDGSGSETVVSGLNSFKPTDISLDLVRHRIFWTDTVTATLRRSTLDGADQVTLFTDLFGNPPRAVAVNPSNGDVYWSHDTDVETSASGEINVALGGEAVFEPVDNIGLGHVNSIALLMGATTCYANCDGSTVPPILNVNDFVCFQTAFAAGDPYANCDHSTIPPVLNVADFVCFQTKFAEGCP